MLHQVEQIVVETLEVQVQEEIGEILEELVVVEQEIHHQLVLPKVTLEDQVQEIIQVVAVVELVQLVLIVQETLVQDLEV